MDINCSSFSLVSFDVVMALCTILVMIAAIKVDSEHPLPIPLTPCTYPIPNLPHTHHHLSPSIPFTPIFPYPSFMHPSKPSTFIYSAQHAWPPSYPSLHQTSSFSSLLLFIPIMHAPIVGTPPHTWHTSPNDTWHTFSSGSASSGFPPRIHVARFSYPDSLKERHTTLTNITSGRLP